MATYKSITKTAQEAGAAKAGQYISDAALISGKVRYVQVDATIRAGGLAAADVVELADLPEGATILPALCKVLVIDAAGDGTWSIGTAADPDALAAGQDVSAVGVFDFTAPTVGSLKLTARTTIQLVTATTTNTAAAEVHVLLAYTVGE